MGTTYDLRLGGHLKPLGIDQVSVLKTARAKANRLFTALSGAVCTGMPSWRAVDVNTSISSSNHVTRAGLSPALK